MFALKLETLEETMNEIQAEYARLKLSHEALDRRAYEKISEEIAIAKRDLNLAEIVVHFSTFPSPEGHWFADVLILATAVTPFGEVSVKIDSTGEDGLDVVPRLTTKGLRELHESLVRANSYLRWHRRAVGVAEAA